jgi:hypothetical protein
VKVAAVILTAAGLAVVGLLWIAVAAGLVALAGLWRRDRLAGAVVTGLLSALAAVGAIEAGSLWAVALILAAGACSAVVSWELRALPADDRCAIGAHRWPLDGDR